MALPNDLFQATWDFSGGQNGWSESFYVQAGGHDQVMDKARNYAKLRKELLAVGYALNTITVSKVNIPGDSLVRVLQGKDSTSSISSDEGDVPWNAYLLRMTDSGRTGRRPMYFRGIADGAVSNSTLKGIRFTDRVFGTRFLNWIGTRNNKAQNGAVVDWSWIGVDKTVVPAIVQDDPAGIRGVQLIAGVIVKIILPGGHGILPDDYVLVTGVKGLTAVNGRYRVDNVIGDTITYTCLKKGIAAQNYIGGGRVRKEELILHDISDVQLIRATHRQTGRPSGVPAGRR